MRQRKCLFKNEWKKGKIQGWGWGVMCIVIPDFNNFGFKELSTVLWSPSFPILQKFKILQNIPLLNQDEKSKSRIFIY